MMFRNCRPPDEKELRDALSSARRTRHVRRAVGTAVGSCGFLEDVRARLAIGCKGRRIAQGEDGCELLEPTNVQTKW